MSRDPFFSSKITIALAACFSLARAEAEASNNHDGNFVAETQLSGAWVADGDLTDEAALCLSIPALGASLRGYAFDKRRGDADEFAAGETAFAGGIYHQLTGSCFVFGALEEEGLRKRIVAPFSRSIAFADDRPAAAADIDADASPSKDQFFYAAIGTPRLMPLRGMVSVVFDQVLNYSAVIALENRPGRLASARIEAALVRKTLDKREPDSWFSEEPPLPQRELKIGAIAMDAASSIASIAADVAISDAYAQGSGAYGNFAFRMSNREWRFLAAVDAASSNFIDAKGSATDARLRVAARVERSKPRGGLLRLDARTVSPYAGATPEEITVSIYLRAADPQKPLFYHLDRCGISFTQDDSEPEGRTDAARMDIGITLGDLRLSTFGVTILETAEGRSNLQETRGGLSLSTRIGPAYFRLGFGATIGEKARPETDSSLNASIHGSLGSLGVKLAHESDPGTWSLSLSWRLHRRVAVPRAQSPRSGRVE